MQQNGNTGIPPKDVKFKLLTTNLGDGDWSCIWNILDGSEGKNQEFHGQEVQEKKILE